MFTSYTSYKFPYLTKKLDQNLQIFDPKITVPVLTPQFGFLDIVFLVDSGADMTLLPLNPYGKLFQFDHTQETPIQVTGIGRSIKAYHSTIKIKIGRQTHSIRMIFAETTTIPLLGRLDFWDKFSIEFNNHHQHTRLTKLKK